MKYRFQGTIKAITFKDARVSVLLENTMFMSNEGDWKQWVDWKLIEGGKYKKGEVWVSAFEQSAPEVFQACKMIEKGSAVELEIYKGEKDFLNINNINLKVPEKDVNEDLEPPDAPFPKGERTHLANEPSSTQRDPDSPEAQAERMVDEEQTKLSPEQEQQMMTAEARVKEQSTTVDTSREALIIRQTCIKAVGAIFKISQDKWARDVDIAIQLAQRLEKYVLEGK